MLTRWCGLLFTAFISLLVSGFCSDAEAAAPKIDVEKFAAIVPGMQKFVDDQEICGGVMMVGTADGIAYLDAVGHRTLDSDQPMPKDAIFRIMSMTKPMTALGLMMLVDEGKASIDDPAEKYLPEFKGQLVTASTDKQAGTVTLKKPNRPITIKDLLTHTGGLPDYPEGLKGLMRKRDHTLAEMEMISSQRPLDFEPGTKWKYSSSGIDVLGRLIEVFSGQAYEDFLAERIFKPLAMPDTGFYVSPQQAERLAELCGQKAGKLVAGQTLPNSMEAEPTVKPKFPSPAGGLYSTAADLSRLYRALLNGGELDGKRIIAAETLKTMTTIQTGDLECSFTPGMSCGLGFHIVRQPQGITQMLAPGSFGHGGAFGTQAWIDLDKGVFYVLLIQRVGLKNSDASDMRREFQTLAAEAVEQ